VAFQKLRDQAIQVCGAGLDQPSDCMRGERDHRKTVAINAR